LVAINECSTGINIIVIACITSTGRIDGFIRGEALGWVTDSEVQVLPITRTAEFRDVDSDSPFVQTNIIFQILFLEARTGKLHWSLGIGLENNQQDVEKTKAYPFIELFELGKNQSGRIDVQNALKNVVDIQSPLARHD
jgi:hypothetical protein